MAAEKILTEASCKAAKPKNAVYYLNDGGGLRLRIKPNGSRSWICSLVKYIFMASEVSM